MRATIVALMLLAASPASARSSGFNPFASLIDCSTIEDPAVTPIEVTTADDLHDVVDTACSADGCASGAIFELAPGTYDDVRVTIGPASEVTAGRVKSGSPTGFNGHVVFRAADPANPPVLRAALDEPTGVFYLIDAHGRTRFENLILDGRSSEQSEAIYTDPAVNGVCEDDDENGGAGDGICDAASADTGGYANGIYMTRISGAVPQVCVYRVQVRNTVGNGIHIRDATNTTIQESTATNIGCTVSNCPNLDVPVVYSANNVKLVARAFNLLVGNGNIGMVGNRASYTTKFCTQCIDGAAGECQTFNNVCSYAQNTGVEYLRASGQAVGNKITNIGEWVEHDTATDYIGHGISWSVNAAAGRKDFLADRNVLSDIWGSGITTQMQASAGANASQIRVANTTVTRACKTNSRADASSFELGDNADTTASLQAFNNTSIESDCNQAFLIQRWLAHRGDGNTVQDTVSGNAVSYEATVMVEDGLDVDADVVIDASSTGTVSNCTLRGSAAVSDSSGGGVTEDCATAEPASVFPYTFPFALGG